MSISDNTDGGDERRAPQPSLDDVPLSRIETIE